MNRSYRMQQEAKRRDQEKRSMPWREYWHLYLSLIATGIMTAFAGVYLGLAPDPSGQILFTSEWDALRRVFFATYYAASFLIVAEGATLFAKDKLLARDVDEVAGRMVDNRAQRVSMSFMLYVSVLAIVATTVAAGYILAAWLGALDKFVTIPVAAQTWVVIGPPALLVFDMVMALIYQQNSKQSELDRWIKQQKRMAEANADEQWAKAYVAAYNEVAPEAAMKAAKATAMTDARKWAGSSVDDIEVTPRHDRLYVALPGEKAVMELDATKEHKALEAPRAGDTYLPKEGDTGVWGGPDHTGPQAHTVTKEEEAAARGAVMEENTMTGEGGADQGSPT